MALSTITCAQAEAAIQAGSVFGCKSSRERWQAILYYAYSWATASTGTITCGQAETAIQAGQVYGCKSPRERKQALVAYASRYG
jgi:3-isopropylmalate dehydratase small subunit